MGEPWPIIGASLLFKYFTEEQRWGEYYTSDRGGAQPTTLNTKPGCVHYSTKHCTRPAHGITVSFKEFNQAFPALIRFPCYHSLNIPFLEKVEVQYQILSFHYWNMKKNIHQCFATAVKRLSDSRACTHQTAIRGHPCHQENQALPRLILPSLAKHPWGCTLVTKMGSSPLLLPLPPATVIPRDSCGSFFTVMCFSWHVTHWERSCLKRINNVV